jgi:hypothetical protein
MQGASHKKTDSSKPKSKKVYLEETFLIKDALQMHKEAMIENAPALKEWELYLRHRIFSDQKFTLITRLIFSYPKKPKTSVMMSQLFPVLTNARIDSSEDNFTKKYLRTPSMGHFQVNFCSVFETRYHGHVQVLGVGLQPAEAKDETCDLRIGLLTTTDHRLSNGLTLSMTNKGSSDKISLFMVTMIVPFVCCRFCAKRTVSPHEPDTTHPRMMKCGRCWDKLHIPVWYCGRQCQTADFDRHRSEEGCGILRL